LGNLQSEIKVVWGDVSLEVRVECHFVPSNIFTPETEVLEAISAEELTGVTGNDRIVTWFGTTAAEQVVLEKVELSEELLQNDYLDFNFANLGKDDLFREFLNDHQLLLQDSNLLGLAHLLANNDELVLVEETVEVSDSKEVIEVR